MPKFNLSHNGLASLAGLTRMWREAFHGLSRFEAGMLGFWLAGPFIYLIERSPADIWLSIIVVVFIARSLVQHDGGWRRLAWVKAVAVFYLTISIASMFSVLWQEALIECLIWLRFPLFAAAVVWWLASTPARLGLMLWSMGLAALLMTCILLGEIWYKFDSFSLQDTYSFRLEGPYGDLLPGAFLGKAMLPLAVVAASFALSRHPMVNSTVNSVVNSMTGHVFNIKANIKALGFGVIVFILVVMTLVTGERVNTAVIGSASIIAALVTAVRYKTWGRLMTYVVLGLAGLGVVFVLYSDMISSHIIGQSLATFGDFFQSPHWSSYHPGLVAAWHYPLTGIGAGMHRYLCPELLELPSVFPGVIQCWNHPHQFYVQLAGETGVFGLAAGVAMIGLIIAASRIHRPTMSKSKSKNTHWLLILRPWIIPVVIFFPQPNFDFFAQWHSLFMWFALSLALALARVANQIHRKISVQTSK